MEQAEPIGNNRPTRAIGLLALLVSVPASVWAAPDLTGQRPVLVIPRVESPPTLEDFLEMKPNKRVEGRLAKVESFIQRVPSDGESSSQRTEVYLGYDDKNLYAIIVAFDSEPKKIRARLVPRDNIRDDDWVHVMIDTFSDQRRGYVFAANALGVQYEALWTESGGGGPGRGGPGRGGGGGGGGGSDSSFDTLWYSRGKLTKEGYLIWMAIPFKSLRFPSTPQQTWGIIFLRNIPRANEQAFWPRVSSRIEGRLNQAARLGGLESISPGRNIQLIPFGVFRSFRALDTRDDQRPRFVRDPADSDAGLDAKFVLKDSLVLDVAVNPDFSQVESDQPQVTANQRFEVFFPEKRPFFLENASFFQTPVNLVFTRRIADPRFGVRLTGKMGPYAIAAMLIDDESPGKSVPVDDPLAGKRATFAIVRASRDIFQQSNIGFIVTDREFEDSYNRVGGIDGRLKLSKNWVGNFQAVTSSTRCLAVDVSSLIDGCFDDDGSGVAGPAYEAELRRSGRQLFYALGYTDRSPGFRTAPGFLRRSDIRRFRQTARYRFRPEGKYLISWGPRFNTEAVFDHSGTRLDLTHDTNLSWEFVGQTQFGVFYNWDRERLRPKDFDVLPENRDFSRQRQGLSFSTSYIPQITLQARYNWGTLINFEPPEGQEPLLANSTRGTIDLTLRPLTPLRIDNSYIVSRLTDRGSGASIFNNHIFRSKWNYQFNRELSLRVILQYDTVLANPELTALDTTKNFNADFLLTYLVNPGTVLYIGYNGNAQNIDLLPTATGAEIIHPRRRFINDAKQFFVKFSYLFRF